MDLQLRDKVVLVTGGAKGIGAAIVRAAAGEGATTVIVDRDAQAAQQLLEELRAQTAACEMVVVDLTTAEGCSRAITRAHERFGRLDTVVNCAGCNDRVGLEQGSPAQFVDSLASNLLHYFNVAHYALPYLKSSRGSIVNIGSKVAHTGQGGTSGYAAAKGAILALTREWAAELLPYGIRVNAVIPAEVMTSLYRNWLDTFPNPQEKLDAVLARIPFEKRMTSPEEVASMVVFLISPKAGHITGQHLFVDGGYVHLDRALT